MKQITRRRPVNYHRPVYVRLSQADYDRIREIAVASELDVSDVIRSACKRFLADLDEGKAT